MMKIDPDFLRLQLDYSRWASERSLEAASALNDEELNRDLGVSYKGVFGTLLHVFQADRIWLSRLRGSPRFSLAEPDESWTLPTLTDGWRNIADGYADWITGVTDAEANLCYKNLAGQDYSLPVWQVVMHIVNHATYHRGQITSMLRQLGYSPIATDLHVFYLSGQT